jgi:hypothetical protein
VSAGSIWKTLGIARTRDRSEIRRAYARALKQTNPEDDPEGFQALRSAYEQALAHAGQTAPSALAVLADVQFVEEAEEPAPPHAEPDERRLQLEGARTRLVQALVADPGPEQDELPGLLQVVLTSPALEEVSAFAETERWLAEAILRTAPRSDCLISQAAERFGWLDDHIKSRSPAVAAVLTRRSDLAFVRSVQSTLHDLHGALRVLMRPPPRGLPWAWLLAPLRVGEVRKLLELIRRDHPGVLARLDQSSLQFWERYFARPRATPAAVLIMLACSIVLTPMLALAVAPEAPPSGRDFLIGAALALAACCAAGALKIYGLDRLQAIWRDDWAWRAPLWRRLGWAPAALALLLVGGAAPASTWMTVALAVAAAATVVWAWIVAEPERGHGSQAMLRALYLNLVLLVWWLAVLKDLPWPVWAQVSWPLGAAVVAAAIGRTSVLNFWYGELPPALRLAFLAVLAGLTGLAAWGLAGAAADRNYAAAAAAGVTLVVFLQRQPAAGLGSAALKLRYYVMWGSGVLLFVAAAPAMADQGGNVSPLFVGGGWLLGGVLLTLLLCLWAEGQAWLDRRSLRLGRATV